MKTQTICGIFAILFLTQGTFGKPTQESIGLTETDHNDHTALKELLTYAYDQLMALGREYIIKCAEVCQNILKDESLMANDESKIVEFKNYLKLFVKENDKQTQKDVFTVWIFITNYLETVKSFVEVSEEKMSRESEFILEILNKYDYQTVNMEYRRKFETFVDNFTNKFEEYKEEVSAKVQQWYKEFKTYTKFDERLSGVFAFMFAFEDNKYKIK